MPRVLEDPSFDWWSEKNKREYEKHGYDNLVRGAQPDGLAFRDRAGNVRVTKKGAALAAVAAAEQFVQIHKLRDGQVWLIRDGDKTLTADSFSDALQSWLFAGLGEEFLVREQKKFVEQNPDFSPSEANRDLVFEVMVRNRLALSAANLTLAWRHVRDGFGSKPPEEMSDEELGKAIFREGRIYARSQKQF